MAIVDPHTLIENLRREPRETGWLEFKASRFDADEVGRYVSGLANAAMFNEEIYAYLIFGVDNDTHELVGTNVALKSRKVGSQIYEHWLCNHLHRSINIEFHSFQSDGLKVEMIVIDPGYIAPVRFKNEAYIRVDSVQQVLRDYPERERALWAITSRFSFEQGVALSHLSPKQISTIFDCESLLSGLRMDRDSKSNVLDRLLIEELIIDDKQGGYDATNLLALLAARDFSKFPMLAVKAPRVIQYKKATKLDAVDDVTGTLGYGIAFSRLLTFIMGKIPAKEEMLHGIRTNKFSIPEISVREILANALIHQDFTQNEGPRVEVFADKVRVTNPGRPLVSTERFIDAPPKSRNKRLASLMTRLGLCEERGSGIDRALDAIEAAALPPPTFQEVEGSTVVTIFGQRSFALMSKEDRIRACYQHASLKYENGSEMSNGSLRARFGLGDKQYPQVSLVIRDSIEAGQIRPLDEDQAKRNARYVPWYA